MVVLCCFGCYSAVYYLGFWLVFWWGMVFGFLLDVRVVTLVESSSCEEVSESDSTLFSSVAALRSNLRIFFSFASPFFRDQLVIPS